MIEVQKDVSLKKHTTFKIGGTADYFVVVNSESELLEAIEFATSNNLPINVLGGGSNLLVSDKGVKGLVVKNEIKGIEYKEDNRQVLVTVGAGEVLDEFVDYAVKQGWWGIENLSHIPGTVGATPVQNVGAYGVEVSDLIDEVTTVDLKTGLRKKFKNSDCHFSYRDSLFKNTLGNNFFITTVTYKLQKNGEPKISYKDLDQYFKNKESIHLADIRKAIISIRNKKFPDWKQIGTAGSFFKNPIISESKFLELKEKYPDLPTYNTESGEIKIALGWILDKVLNLRGVRKDRVGTFQGQALVIVNHGNATAEDVEKFAEQIASKVAEVTEIKIQWEVTKW